MYKKFSLFVVLSIFTVCAMSLTVAQAQDKITLRVWDTWTDGTRNSGMEKLVAAFEEANPGVKIVRDVQSIDEMRPIMRTALDSGTGPDILYYDSGPGFAGVLAEAG